MQVLNLPKTELMITKQGDTYCIFDVLRRRHIRLTAEEWVRQHFVHYLLEHKGFPAARMANEISITLNHTTKRCDTVCYDGNARPMVIIEYKAPHIALSRHTLDQIRRYNMVLHVPYLILSNGIQHICIHIDYATGEYRFLNDIPRWEELHII